MNRARVASLLVLTALVAGPSGQVGADPPEFRLRAGFVTSNFGIFGSTTGSSQASFVDAGGFGTPGFAAGIEARLPLSGQFSLQFGALYVRKTGRLGFTFRPDFLPPGFGLSGVTIRTSIDYVEFPVTLRYDLHIDKVRPYVFAGAALATKLSATANFTDGRALDRIGIGPIDELIRSSDTTLVLGAGVDFMNSRWGVEMRGSLGLRSAFESPTPSGQVLESSARTRAFMLLVGYRF